MEEPVPVRNKFRKGNSKPTEGNNPPEGDHIPKVAAGSAHDGKT